MSEENDRELLELAAKAAGYQVDCGFSDCPVIFGNDAGPDGPREWNPLTDDGDALRLAADLDLFGGQDYWHFLSLARLRNSVDKHGNVRRAIVRAAAEIGRRPHETDHA